MEFGWYSLILFVISLPGSFFRRMYYIGGFTNQFKPINIIVSTFYNIIIGVFIVLLSVFLFNNLIVNDSCTYLDKINSLGFNKFIEDVNSQGSNYVIQKLLNKQFVLKLFFFIILVFSVSAFLGSLCYHFVRFSKLDKKLVFLKFENYWHYYFKGEFKDFKEYKTLRKIVGDLKVKKFKFMRADILVDVGEEKTKLYTGIIFDYELNRDNSLELIYLLLPGEYKDKKVKFIEPSETFIIPYKLVKNINLRAAYVDQSIIEYKRKKKWENFYGFIVLFLTVTPFFLPIFYNLEFTIFARVILGLSIGSIPIAFSNYNSLKKKYPLIFSKKRKILRKHVLIGFSVNILFMVVIYWFVYLISLIF